MMSDRAHADDMQAPHQLFDHGSEITRHVVMRPDRLEAVTESMNAHVRRLLQAHVTSIAQVQDGRPIHRRDPLFAELFHYADQTDAEHELTADGVRVASTVAFVLASARLQTRPSCIDDQVRK